MPDIVPETEFLRVLLARDMSDWLLAIPKGICKIMKLGDFKSVEDGF